MEKLGLMGPVVNSNLNLREPPQEKSGGVSTKTSAWEEIFIKIHTLGLLGYTPSSRRKTFKFSWPTISVDNFRTFSRAAGMVPCHEAAVSEKEAHPLSLTRPCLPRRNPKMGKEKLSLPHSNQLPPPARTFNAETNFSIFLDVNGKESFGLKKRHWT